jgi:hypothetical protein
MFPQRLDLDHVAWPVPQPHARRGARADDTISMTTASLKDRFDQARGQAMAAAAPEALEGRGIVICAGGARLFTCAWVAIGLLRRHLGCTLPIQVWHMGSEELGPAMRDMLGRFDVEVVDAFEMARLHPVQRLAGWELKPYALMHSRFAEVMLLDADNMPLMDPGFLFETPEYLAKGAMFWPDVVRIGRDNPVWAVAGLEPWRGSSLESGQLVIDKRRCWAALHLCQWMNQNAGDFYEMIWGDKDTFLVAWLATDSPFHLVPHAPAQLEGVLCQRSPDGEVMFQHRTNAKWILAGRAAPVEGFQMQAECSALLAELAAQWDGWIYNPPARSERAREMERALVEQGRFTLTRVSYDHKTVELLSRHRIGQGASHDLVYWHVEDAGDDLALVLRQGGFVSARLTQDDDGTWRGGWLQAPNPPVELAPLIEAAPVAHEPERDAALETLLEDMRAAFEALSPDAQTIEAFAHSLATIARVRPAAWAWLDRQAGGSVAAGRAAARALDLIGSPGVRFRPPSSVQARSLEAGLGYERD